MRKILRGAFANTAFCVLAPDGEKQLTMGGRSPAALFGRRGGTDLDVDRVVQEMKELASQYEVRADGKEAVLQDFHTFRQALNVASGDQRLLVLTVASENKRDKVEKTLQAVFNDPTIEGVFHHDFLDSSKDKNWVEQVKGEKEGLGFVVIQADEFGTEGEVVAQLPLNSTADQLKKKLLVVNEAFAKSEKRKNYNQHVQTGRRNRVYFENEMPYGEDRDGDGKIDERRRGR